MRIDRVDTADDDYVCARVTICSGLPASVDDPAGRDVPFRVFRIWMTTGWDDSPREMWTARTDDGTLLGLLA